MYVITGATGNTGSRITEHLLQAGKSVRAIGRSAERLNPLVEQGAEAAVGELEDTEFLTKAFEGATAVYALIPPAFADGDFRAYQNRVGRSIAGAIRKASVKHVVTLSSIGAHSPETGVVAGLYDFEQELAKHQGINVLNLRAGFFMQNLLGNIGIIRQMGINGGFPIDGNTEIPMVHTNDIADVAAKHLLKLDFQGQSHTYVAGQRDLTFQEATKILGAAIDKPELPWVTFSYEDAKGGMLQNGFPESLADNYLKFSRAANEGILMEDYQRQPEFTTPTSIEDFTREFAAAYKAG
ncbi:MAG: NmrA family NAD(P)-binding protein [Lewinellaceae bacterium]|nr:NmrA family NAD(P)-binding protein [Phaeodactylibacter sp.]MCB9038524.1 NmrA family NAD(P)-binding protein [Lewinellaceae bacterium]